MKSMYSKYVKLVALAAALPFIYGCGGAGVGSLVGFLFGSGGGIGPIALLGSSGAGAGAGAGSVASLVNPEPASMLLVGGGIMAMSYFKSKTDRRSK
jgi:hypothetical protein